MDTDTLLPHLPATLPLTLPLHPRGAQGCSLNALVLRISQHRELRDRDGQADPEALRWKQTEEARPGGMEERGRGGKVERERNWSQRKDRGGTQRGENELVGLADNPVSPLYL